MKKIMMGLMAVMAFAGCSQISGEDTSSSKLIKIASADGADFAKYVEENENVLVKCFATWCGPCIASMPTDEKLANKYDGKVTFLKVDVDLNKQWVSKLGVRGVPAYLAYKNGKLKERWTGAKQEADYEATIKRIFEL